MSDAVRETLDRYYAALKAGDREALRGVVSDEIEVHYPAPEGLLPWAGDWAGFDGFESFVATVGDHLVIDTVEPLAVHVAGELAHGVADPPVTPQVLGLVAALLEVVELVLERPEILLGHLEQHEVDLEVGHGSAPLASSPVPPRPV